MNLSSQRDIGAHITSRFADQVDAVAAGAGDATESSGPWVQRPHRAQSAKLVIAFEAVLAEDETLSIAANAQDAADSSGTGAADFGDAIASAVVATGGTGGSTERGVVGLDLNLAGAAEYLRSQVTPNLSAGATDTLRLTAVWIFGGLEKLPAA